MRPVDSRFALCGIKYFGFLRNIYQGFPRAVWIFGNYADEPPYKACNFTKVLLTPDGILCKQQKIWIKKASESGQVKFDVWTKKCNNVNHPDGSVWPDAEGNGAVRISYGTVTRHYRVNLSRLRAGKWRYLWQTGIRNTVYIRQARAGFKGRFFMEARQTAVNSAKWEIIRILMNSRSYGIWKSAAANKNMR